MKPGDRLAGHVPAAEAFRDPGEIRIGGEGRPAPCGEVDRPSPGGVVEHGEGPRIGDLGPQFMLAEAATAGDGDQMLREAVESAGERTAGLDHSRGHRLPGRRAFDQFEGMGRHADEPARRAGGVAAASGPLQQPGDPLRTADLQHLLDRAEVDAEVEARRRHDTLESTSAEALLGRGPLVAIDRSVVQRDDGLPIGPCRTDRLEPTFRLRPRVGEHERRGAGLDPLDDLRQEPHAHVARPGKPLHRPRDEGFDLEPTGHAGLHEMRGGSPRRAGERRHRLVEVRKRGGEPPRDDVRRESPQPGQRQLRLHAALRGEQFVPFVDDDRLEA